MMSEIMLLGVLRMPPDCWDDTDPIDVAQRYGRYCEAAWEIERLRAVLTEIQEEAEHMLPSDNDPTIAEGLAHTIYLMTMRGLGA